MSLPPFHSTESVSVSVSFSVSCTLDKTFVSVTPLDRICLCLFTELIFCLFRCLLFGPRLPLFFFLSLFRLQTGSVSLCFSSGRISTPFCLHFPTLSVSPPIHTESFSVSVSIDRSYWETEIPFSVSLSPNQTGPACVYLTKWLSVSVSVFFYSKTVCLCIY